MARFTRAELEAYRDAEVPDLLPGGEDPALRLLFVGINPGLWTAATSTHFAHPTNRFYPALERAGIIAQPIDPAAGMTDADRAALRARGIGITNLVRRATARADELSTAELRAGGEALRERVARYSPRVVAIAGLTAYRSAFRQTKAAAGRQLDDWQADDGPVQVWVVPNPSGLNAHDSVASLAQAYGAAARAAGVQLDVDG